MKFLLIPGEQQNPLLDALAVCYERFKVRDAQRTEEMRKEGIIVAYSQMHMIYEMPIDAIKHAERVSFSDGILGPPVPDGAYFFLLGDNYQRHLSAMLKRDGFEELGESIANARMVTLPQVYGFTDADEHVLEIIGWDEADARRRLEKCGMGKPPFTWYCSYIAFPLGGAVFRGKAPQWEDSEPYSPEEEDPFVEGEL